MHYYLWIKQNYNIFNNYTISHQKLFKINFRTLDNERYIFLFKRYEKEKLVNFIKEYLKYQKSHLKF